MKFNYREGVILQNKYNFTSLLSGNKLVQAIVEARQCKRQYLINYLKG